MKKSINIRAIILLAVFSIGLLSGCNDNFLDKDPTESLSTSTFWINESDAMLALTGVYYIEGMDGTGAKQMYDFWNQDTYLRLFEATTDNGFEKDDQVTDFNNGNLTSANGVVESLWSNSYVKITKCNNFLENIDAVEIDADELAEIKAEVKTIRAYNYFYMAFLWGDVPLVTNVLSVSEANSVTRTPKDEVIDFVIKELQDAIEDLPVTRADDEDGRITRGGAMAILGRVFLAEEQWENAKNIYEQIIDLGIYSIDARFKDLFVEAGENSDEIILKSKRMPDVYGNSILLSCEGFTWGGYHHYSPYNELVEEFECIDGKPTSESPLYDVDNPYENRDPRLYATIGIDKLTVFKDILYVSHPDSSATTYKDQLTRRPWSGYLLFKYYDEDYEGNLRLYGCDFPMIRYAEVLLSYLEACIESGTTITQELLDETINLVRGREEVAMPSVTVTDIDNLTTILRRERRVELAWEGLRLYDLFRWKEADNYLTARFHGMKLCTTPEAASYTKFTVNENGYYFCEETDFDADVDYLWPIPQSERDVNSNLTQNDGY